MTQMREDRGRRRPLADDTRVWVSVVAVVLVVTVSLGVAVAFAPLATLAVLAGAALLAALVFKVEWVVYLVVMVAPFEDYVRVVHADVVKGLALLLFLGWATRRLARPDPGSLRHPVIGACLAFFVVLLAATALHTNGSLGLDVASRYVGFLGVTVVLVDLMRRGLPPQRLARAFVAACAVASVCGIVSYFVADTGRVGGPLEDPNDLAFFLVAALPFALALRVSARRRWVYDLASLVMLLALAGTLSRGGAVGLIVLVAFAVALRQVRPIAVVGLAVVALAGLGLAMAAAPDRVEDSLSNKSSIADQNVNDRLGLWLIAAEMTARNPVLGLGPGGYQTNFEVYSEGTPVDVSRDIDVSHNMYLETSSEFGLLGLAALLAIMGGGCAARHPPVEPRPRPHGRRCHLRPHRGRGSCVLPHRAVLPARVAAVGPRSRPVADHRAQGVIRPGGRRVRVVQLLTQSVGGPADHVADVAEVLARRGHDSHVVGPRSLATDRVTTAGVTWHELHMGDKTDLRGGREVARRVRDLAPDVLHLQDRRAGLIGRVLAPTLRHSGIVYTLHGVADGLSDLVTGNVRAARRRRRDSLYYLTGERALTRLGRGRVVVPSEAVARFATEHVRLPPALLDVVSNGVDTERFRPGPVAAGSAHPGVAGGARPGEADRRAPRRPGAIGGYRPPDRGRRA